MKKPVLVSNSEEPEGSTQSISANVSHTSNSKKSPNNSSPTEPSSHISLTNEKGLIDGAYNCLFHFDPEKSKETLLIVFRCIGRKLAERRYNMNLSQKELGKRAGVSTSYISKIECGRNCSGITLQILWTIAHAVNFQLGELFSISLKDIERLYHYDKCDYQNR